MSFNEEELSKIKESTSGWFKKSARTAITQAILTIKPKIDAAKILDETKREEEFIVLLNDTTNERHQALQSGANSYGDPQWAAAATCESWLHELIGGTPESIAKVELLIEELSKR